MLRPLTLLLAVAVASCGGEPGASVPLDALVLRDSLYLEAESLEPFTGRVHRMFEDDPDEVQIEGALLEGTWDGEFTVYHDNGRIRYLGFFDRGDRCGSWIENRDADPPEDILTELKQEIESMGLYPPCPEG